MKKRSFLALLAFLMSLVLLTACGGGTDPDDNAGEWWVFAPDYKPEGLPLFEVLRWNGTDHTAMGYSHTGEETFEATVFVDGSRITFDIDITSATYIMEGDTLVDPDTKEAVFVRTDDPHFQKAAMNLDGVWYRSGRPDAASRLEIHGDTYTLTDEEYGRTETGKWEPGPDTVLLPDGTKLKTPPQFKAEFPGPAGYPAADGKVLLLEEHFGYAGYVHESAMDGSPEVDAALLSLSVLNSNWEATTEDGRAILTFYPNYFQIRYYAVDGNGLENPDPNYQPLAGTWAYAVTDSLSMDFTDGTQLQFGFGPSTGEIEVDSLGLIFLRR